MLEELTQFKEVKSWDEACMHFRRFLGADEPISPSILIRASKDDIFAHYLLTSRGYPYMLKPLFKDVKNRIYELSGKGGDKRLFNEIIEKVFKLAHGSYTSPEENDYQKKYGIYFGFQDSTNSNSKPCKPCVEIKAQDFKEVYLDYNSTTPIRTEIKELLEDYYSGKYSFGNPSSNTIQGYYMSDLIWEARKRIADCLSTEPREIFFTGSGSEVNNLAIKGIAFMHLEKKGHIVTSKVAFVRTVYTFCFCLLANTRFPFVCTYR